MRPRRSIPIVFLLYVGLITLPVSLLADVFARVSYEGKNTDIRNITFTSDLFVQFYTCMCLGKASTCKAKYGYAGSNWVANEIDSDGTMQNKLQSCMLYQCGNYAKTMSLNCTRLPEQGTSCAQLVSPSFINLRNVSGCAATCVGVTWTIREESLNIDRSKVKVQVCNTCCSGTTEVPTSASTLPAEIQSPAEFNESNLYTDKERFENIIIVCGIAGGVILIAVIVFVILLRVPLKSASLERRNNRPVTIATGGTKHVQDVSWDAETKQSNLSQGFGFLNALKKKNSQIGLSTKEIRTILLLVLTI